MSPDIVLTQTPMRISFLGGGSDLPLFTESGNGPGCCVSATIDKYVAVLAKRRWDELIVCHYRITEQAHIQEIEYLNNAYVREALKWVGWQDGIEITSMSDVPIDGAGLGGSSAFLIGMLKALYVLQGKLKLEEDLAEEAFRLETGPLGKQIGRQDHWAAAFGGFRRYDFLPGGEVQEVFLGDLSWASGRILLLHTGNPHAAESVFADVHRPGNEERNLFLYSVLADLGRKGAFFAQKICWEKFFGLIEENWLAKKATSGLISNPEIEKMIADAKTAGAQQVKICGTGGGGHLLCYCPEGRDVVLERLEAAGEHPIDLPVEFANEWSRVLYQD